MRESFKLFWLLATLIMGVVLAVPGLFFLTTIFLDDRKIFYGVDPLRFGLFILIISGCVGLMVWLLGKGKKRRTTQWETFVSS